MFQTNFARKFQQVKSVMDPPHGPWHTSHHRAIHETMVYLPIKVVDVYGINVGKYTIHLDVFWDSSPFEAHHLREKIYGSLFPFGIVAMQIQSRHQSRRKTILLPPWVRWWTGMCSIGLVMVMESSCLGWMESIFLLFFSQDGGFEDVWWNLSKSQLDEWLGGGFNLNDISTTDPSRSNRIDVRKIPSPGHRNIEI